MRAVPALLLLAVAVPAAAQIAPRHDYGPVVAPSPTYGSSMTAPPNPRSERVRARLLRQDIDRAARQGLITRREARSDATRFVRQTSEPQVASFAPPPLVAARRDALSQDVRRCPPPPTEDRGRERPSYCR